MAAAAPIGDDDLRALLREKLASRADDSISLKAIREEIEGELGASLADRKGLIKEVVSAFLEEREEEEKQNQAEGAEEEDEGEVEEPSGSKRRRPGTGGFAAPKQLSPELADLLGEPIMPRTMVVKKMWAYIREHELQDPSDRRNILLDEPMSRVFGRDSFSMLQMNKLLSDHLSPADHMPPHIIEQLEEAPSKRRKAATKKEKKVASGGSSAGKGTGLQKPMLLSDELAEVVGVRQCSRPQVVKKIWEYIRANELQPQYQHRRWPQQARHTVSITSSALEQRLAFFLHAEPGQQA